jgi:hypothetical protein
MQSMGMSIEDLIDEAEPYRDEPDPS